MIDFEMIETFLSNPQNYLFKFSYFFNIYKERFKKDIERENIKIWESEAFLVKIRGSYEFLKLNFYQLKKTFYTKTNLELIDFPFIPFVGFGVVSEWIDIYKNSIHSFLPLENINSLRNLIVMIYKTYSMGYILNRNTSLLELSFYNNLRNLIMYGFGNYVSKICTNNSILIPIFQNQRSIHKIFQVDTEKNLKYYLFRFLKEIDDSSLGQFFDWFIISKRGQYLGYKFFEFQSNNFKNFLNVNFEIYKFKLLQFYENI